MPVRYLTQKVGQPANGEMADTKAPHSNPQSTIHYTHQTLDTFSEGKTPDYEEIERFNRWVGEACTEDGYPLEAYRTDTQDTAVRIQRLDGMALDVLSFASYSFYLGYSRHPEVIAAAKTALDQYGLGAGSSPLIGGRLALHVALEQALIDFFRLPDRGATIFPSGFGANTGTVSAFANGGDVILFDECCHASLLEGALLSGAEIRHFRHNDADHLASCLRRIRSRPDGEMVRILVGMEGCYSADGDYGKLDQLIPMAKRYRAKVLVDEAHSMLMIGPNGKGMAAEMGVLEEVDLLMITFSKAFGGIGGACYASKEVTQYLNFFAKSRMFSCALDPAVTAGITRVLQIAGNSRWGCPACPTPCQRLASASALGWSGRHRTERKLDRARYLWRGCAGPARARLHSAAWLGRRCYAVSGGAAWTGTSASLCDGRAYRRAGGCRGRNHLGGCRCIQLSQWTLIGSSGADSATTTRTIAGSTSPATR